MGMSPSNIILATEGGLVPGLDMIQNPETAFQVSN